MSNYGLIGPTIAIVLAVLGAALGSLWLLAAAICWVTLSLWASVNC